MTIAAPPETMADGDSIEPLHRRLGLTDGELDAIRDRHGEDAVRHGLDRVRSTPWGPDG